ncbi:hypothetical protein MLD38_039317 [Melastoma candidum]|uniref:Uncharacterized protein n=1 Tax=Melastoma candidum TaxID=119954 RepID=A0ACB9L326_9MYRT|nr:hypothetical protein MLD38_039317 [Melastoma candidum]
MSGYALAIDVVLEELVNNTATNGYKCIYDGVPGFPHEEKQSRGQFLENGKHSEMSPGNQGRGAGRLDKHEKPVDELTSSVQAEQLAWDELKEAQNAEIERLHRSLPAMRTKVDEATTLLLTKIGIAQKIIKDALQLMTSLRDLVHNAELIKTVNDELEHLKVGF